MIYSRVQLSNYTVQILIHVLDVTMYNNFGYLVFNSLETFHYPDSTLVALSLHEAEAPKTYIWAVDREIITLCTGQTMHIPNPINLQASCKSKT